MQLGSSNEMTLWLGVTRTVLKAGSIRKVENHGILENEKEESIAFQKKPVERPTTPCTGADVWCRFLLWLDPQIPRVLPRLGPKQVTQFAEGTILSLQGLCEPFL